MYTSVFNITSQILHVSDVSCVTAHKTITFVGITLFLAYTSYYVPNALLLQHSTYTHAAGNSISLGTCSYNFQQIKGEVQ